MDAILTGLPFDLPILSYAGTRIYYLVLTRSTPEPIEFRFCKNFPEFINYVDLSFARSADA